MKIKNFLSLVLMLFITTATFAITQETAEPLTAETVVLWLTAPAVFLGTAIVRWAKPSIPGWATVLVVSGLSTVLAWITNIVVDGDTSFFAKVAIGLGAIVISQVYRQFTGGNSAAKAK